MLHFLLRYDSEAVYNNPGFQCLLQQHSKSQSKPTIDES